jgi:hypothetical protein
MSPPAKRSMTARPDSSRNESQKSMITRLFSPSASESSPSESATRITERNMMREKNRLRTISRNVLRAMLNIVDGTLYGIIFRHPEVRRIQVPIFHLKYLSIQHSNFLSVLFFFFSLFILGPFLVWEHQWIDQRFHNIQEYVLGIF